MAVQSFTSPPQTPDAIEFTDGAANIATEVTCPQYGAVLLFYCYAVGGYICIDQTQSDGDDLSAKVQIPLPESTTADPKPFALSIDEGIGSATRIKKVLCASGGSSAWLVVAEGKQG